MQIVLESQFNDLFSGAITYIIFIYEMLMGGLSFSKPVNFLIYIYPQQLDREERNIAVEVPPLVVFFIDQTMLDQSLRQLSVKPHGTKTVEVMEVMRKIINCYFVCMYCKLYRSDTDKSSKSKPEQCLEFCEELEIESF